MQIPHLSVNLQYREYQLVNNWELLNFHLATCTSVARTNKMLSIKNVYMMGYASTEWSMLNHVTFCFHNITVEHTVWDYTYILARS